MRIIRVFRGVWREKKGRRRRKKESNGEREETKRTGVVYSTGKKSTTGATITPLTYNYYVVEKSFVCYHKPKR